MPVTDTIRVLAHYRGSIREQHGPCTVLRPCDLFGENPDRFVIRTMHGEELRNVRLESLEISRVESKVDHFLTHDGRLHHGSCITTAPMGAALTAREAMLVLYNHDAKPCPACVQF